jgi:hypothetical protein
MFKCIVKWMYSYPDPDNCELAYDIKKQIQRLFPCKHQWIVSSGGMRRKCTKCWKHQYQSFSKYPRPEWEDLPPKITS